MAFIWINFSQNSTKNRLISMSFKLVIPNDLTGEKKTVSNFVDWTGLRLFHLKPRTT